LIGTTTALWIHRLSLPFQLSRLRERPSSTLLTTPLSPPIWPSILILALGFPTLSFPIDLTGNTPQDLWLFIP
jgi:hypothetical protein